MDTSVTLMEMYQVKLITVLIFDQVTSTDYFPKYNYVCTYLENTVSLTSS